MAKYFLEICTRCYVLDIHVQFYWATEDMDAIEHGPSDYKVNFLLKILLFEVSRRRNKKKITEKRSAKNRRSITWKIRVIRAAWRQERQRRRREGKEHFPWHSPWYADSPPRLPSFCNGDRQPDRHKDEAPRWWNKMKGKARKECLAAGTVGWI
jgi:hypothetical protein